MKKAAFIIFFLFSFYISHSQDFTITYDSLLRSYRLHLPINYSPDSLYPLVINMHGLGSNAWEQEVYTEFDNVADTGRFIVAYPNGIGETWNVSSSIGTDDVGFISALIDTLDYLYKIDLQRVYATGMSMGGFMSYRLACELSDRIVAIGSVAGLQAFYPCTPSRPVPVVHFHGTADQVVPFIGVSTTINNWIGYNGCPDTAVVTELPDIVPEDNSTVTVSYFGPCSNASEVILYKINGGEHTWPGAQIIIGVTNQDIKASNEIWNFFKKFTLDGTTGIGGEAVNQKIGYQFFPNPVEGVAVVELDKIPEKPVVFRIIDLNGRSLLEIHGITGKRFLIDCSGIPSGLYLSEIQSVERSYYKKIIIQ
jgi:polyhydroxybutyrate depolymerase